MKAAEAWGLLFAADDKGPLANLKINPLSIDKKGGQKSSLVEFIRPDRMVFLETNNEERVLTFPNFQDYGYGIFLLDNKSRDYVLKNIQNEKDDFLRTMMWGSLWDSVREAELDPKDYVELVIKRSECKL
ncbi:MAG: hypothetical protein IPK01_06760 [Acidobacteria bacterium]|nr:hypothetical protein [Acidobacteriota bacterium]